MRRLVLMIALFAQPLAKAQDGVSNTLRLVSMVGGPAVISANPVLFNSTGNPTGIWGNPDFVFSFTNPSGLFGSLDSVYSVNNDYGFGLRVDAFQPGLELIEVPFEVP